MGTNAQLDKPGWLKWYEELPGDFPKPPLQEVQRGAEMAYSAARFLAQRPFRPFMVKVGGESHRVVRPGTVIPTWEALLLGLDVSDGVAEERRSFFWNDVQEIVEAEAEEPASGTRTRPWRSMRRAKLAVKVAAFLCADPFRPFSAVAGGDRYDIMEPVAIPTLTALYFGRALDGGSRLEKGVAYSVMGLPWGTVQDIGLKTVGEA